MITLPTREGYLIEWETGERWKNGKPKKDSTCVKSKVLADKIADQKRKEGFRNVEIYECIY